MKTIVYERSVHYYETDRMGCVHHSNYIRWFEEARIYLMQKWGFPYDLLEADGVLSPVLTAAAEYKTMTRFGETVLVELGIESYSGTRIAFAYTVRDKESGAVRCTGRTTHCFINEGGRPLSLKKVCPQYDAAIRRSIEE